MTFLTFDIRILTILSYDTLLLKSQESGIIRIHKIYFLLNATTGFGHQNSKIFLYHIK